MSSRLIVEIDGGQHAEEKAYDDARSEYLRDEGFEIIRCWNNEVLGNLDAVLQAILAAVAR
jgi:adenine-specific DNA-methyltransferase